MSDSVRPHRWQPIRLHRPWDSPGKNTGADCHFLLQCMKVKTESEVSQLCLTLSDPMDCSLPGSSIHGIFQARVLEWGAIAFSEYDTIYNEILFSHKKKKKPFLTTWKSFEDIILSEISWIENTNIVWSHIQNTNVSVIKTESTGDYQGLGVWRKWADDGQRLLTSIYKMSSKDLIYSMVTIINKIILYFLKFERVDLKCSHHTYTHKW